MIECVDDSGAGRFYGLRKGGLYRVLAIPHGGHMCAHDRCGFNFVVIAGPLPDPPSKGWCPNRFARRSSQKAIEGILAVAKKAKAPKIIEKVR